MGSSTADRSSRCVRFTVGTGFMGTCAANRDTEMAALCVVAMRLIKRG